MSYYIKGNKERGDEVIALLESKGGKNTHGLSGESIGSYYFIDKNNAIVSYPSEDCFELLGFFGEELTLPEKWKPKFKVDDKVIFVYNLETIIGIIKSVDNLYKSYTIATYKDAVAYENHLVDKIYYQREEKLSLYKWEPKFKIGDYVVHTHLTTPGRIAGICNDSYDIEYSDKSVSYHCTEDNLTLWKPSRGETVLVKNYFKASWNEAVFSYKSIEEGTTYYSTVGGAAWEFCIPFDINKLGKVKD